MEYIIASLVAILFATLIVYKLANNILGLGLRLRSILLCAACAMFISIFLPKVVVGFAGLPGTLALLAIFAIIFAYFVAKYEDEPSIQDIDAETESACCLATTPNQPDMLIQREVFEKSSNEIDNNDGSMGNIVQILENHNTHSTEEWPSKLITSESDFNEFSIRDTMSLDNNTIESTDGVIDSIKTELVGKVLTEDPVVQEEDPVVQEEDSVVKEEDPVVQEEDPVVQEEDPVVQEEDPVVQEEDPVVQEEDPVVQEEDSVVQEEDAVIQEEDAVIQEEDAVIQEEDAVIQEEDPIDDSPSLVPIIIEPNLSETDDCGLVTDSISILENDHLASQPVQQDDETLTDFLEEAAVETIAEQNIMSMDLLSEESLLIEELEELSQRSMEVLKQMPDEIAGNEEIKQESVIFVPEQSFVQEADNSIMTDNKQAVELAQFESEQLDDLLDFAFLSKESQEYSTAFNAFSRALSLYPNSEAAPFIVVEIGNILKNNGAYDEAIKVFLDGRNLSKIKQDDMMEQELISTIAYLRITKNILIQNHLGCIPFLEIPSQVMEQIDEEFREWRSVSNI